MNGKEDRDLLAPRILYDILFLYTFYSTFITPNIFIKTTFSRYVYCVLFYVSLDARRFSIRSHSAIELVYFCFLF